MKNFRLTKRKALEITAELWQWMVENPGNLKYQWPGWEKYGEMYGACACCEYARRHSHGPIKDNCVPCPLYGKWSKEEHSICDDGPYADWERSKSSKARTKHALAIVELCKTELEGMPKRKSLLTKSPR